MAQTSIHADLHVFGSTRGYGTVAASRSVRDDEKRELESFQFGEASTSDRIARLATHAVMTGRALRSGRFAISRMMPAGIDDAGRPTVEVITLLINGRDYERCTGALPMLASDADLWRKARAEAASGMSIAAVAGEVEPSDPQVMRIFDLWRAASSAGAIGVVSESDSDAVLRMVASLDPADRLRCNWGIGLLSISTSADICSVAPGISMHGARDVMRLARDGAWHCGSESEYAAFRVMNGARWLPSIAEIETNGRPIEIATGGGVATAVGSGVTSRVSAHHPPRRERPLLPFAIGSAVLSTVVLAVSIGMFVMRDRPTIQPQSGGSEPQTVQPVQTPDEMSGPVPTAEAAKETPPPPQPDATPFESPSMTESQTEKVTPKAASQSDGRAPDQTRGSGGTNIGGDKSDKSKTPVEKSPSTEPEGGQPLPGPRRDTGSPGGQSPDPDGRGAAGGNSGREVEAKTSDTSVTAEARELEPQVEKLKSIAPVSPPSQESIHQQFNGNQELAWSAAIESARRAGKDVALVLIKVVEIDQKLKRGAKVQWDDGAATSKSWTLIASRNGFICVKPSNGPGGSKQNDVLLNRELLKIWKKILDEIERVRPPAVENNLIQSWKAGVDGVLKDVPKNDGDFNAIKASMDLLFDAEARTNEYRRVERVLKEPAVEDSKPEPTCSSK